MKTASNCPVLFSEHLIGDGQKMFEHAAKLNWEGIISKRADAPYRSERNENWLKIKAVQKGKFPVVGFVKDPTRRRGAVPRQAGRQRTGLHGQGGDRLVSHCLQPDQEATRHRRQPEVKANQTHQEAKGDMGRAEILRRR